MQHLLGQGSLTCPHYPAVNVQYDLDVEWDGEVVSSVRGTVKGSSPLHLGAVPSGLELSDGRQIRIVFGRSYNMISHRYQVRWPADEQFEPN